MWPHRTQSIRLFGARGPRIVERLRLEVPGYFFESQAGGSCTNCPKTGLENAQVAYRTTQTMKGMMVQMAFMIALY